MIGDPEGEHQNPMSLMENLRLRTQRKNLFSPLSYHIPLEIFWSLE
jgi:hypothetical protein